MRREGAFVLIPKPRKFARQEMRCLNAFLSLFKRVLHTEIYRNFIGTMAETRSGNFKSNFAIHRFDST